MPGQLMDGITDTRNINITNSKAFCEGRQAKALCKEVTANPYSDSSEASLAWIAGHTLDAASGVVGPCNISSAAFCEGRQAKAWGKLIGDNPYPSRSDEEVAWGTGFALDIASGIVGPCDIIDGVVVPDLEGRTRIEATEDLEAVGLLLGEIHEIGVLVVSQDPVADSLVEPGSFIDITMDGNPA